MQEAPGGPEVNHGGSERAAGPQGSNNNYYITITITWTCLVLYATFPNMRIIWSSINLQSRMMGGGTRTLNMNK
jgi:hypothetical protein